MTAFLRRNLWVLPVWTWAVLLIVLLAHFASAAHLDLAFDEAYYWTWSQHLQLSYYDHPPLVAWMIALSTFFLGNSEFGVRFFAPLSLFGSCILLARAARDFGGDKRAVILAALLPVCTIAGHASGLIITPDTLLLLMSSLVVACLAAFYRSNNPNWWLAIGVAGGAAMLAKYSAVALAIGILIWLMSSRQRLQYFRSWQIWLGALTALAVFSPVLIWNAQNGWASFAKQGGRTLGDYSFSFHTALNFIFSQAGLLTPFIAALIIYSAFQSLRGARNGNSREILLCALALPFFFYLTFVSFGMKTEANWSLVCFAPLLVMTALTVSEKWAAISRFTKVALLSGAALSATLLIYLAVPIPHSFGRQDPTQRLSGNAIMGANVEKLASMNQACMVLTNDYANTALLSYYMRGKRDVMQMNEPERTAGWTLADRNTCAGQNVLLLTSQRLQDGPIVSPYLSETKKIALVRRGHRGKVVEIYNVYKAKLALVP